MVRSGIGNGAPFSYGTAFSGLRCLLCEERDLKRARVSDDVYPGPRPVLVTCNEPMLQSPRPLVAAESRVRIS